MKSVDHNGTTSKSDYIINGDSLDCLPDCDMIFADPPDGIGLDYIGFADYFADYPAWLRAFLIEALCAAPVVWVSFNAKWTADMGLIWSGIKPDFPTVRLRPMVQTFTFGQHQTRDFVNGHRPLWRFSRLGATCHPPRIESQRQRDGDPRANPEGRLPSDVFDFPRVTGNSKQRRNWHPTQLNEALVERCILSSTNPGDHVCDPFAGTGTTLRVCKRIDRRCTLIEISPYYYNRLVQEHNEHHPPSSGSDSV